MPLMLKVATKFAPNEASFRQAVEAGFQYAEIWTDPGVLANARQVIDLAAKFPLQYGIHFPNRKDLEPVSLGQAIDWYEGLGCRAMVIHQPHFDRYAAELRRLKSDLVLAIENHKLSLDQLKQWFEKTEFLTLDVEHVWKFTLHGPPIDELWKRLDPLLERHGHKLRHVHLPGYVPGYDEHRPMYCNRDLVLGMFDRLGRLDYSGLIVSEIATEFQNVNDLRMDVLLYDTWLQARSCATPAGKSAAG